MTDVSVMEILEGHAARDPDRLAVINDRGSITYAEFAGRVAALAAWLADNGLDAEATVAVSLTDEFDHLLTAMALLALGARQVCLPSHETAETNRAVAERLSVRQIVCAVLEVWAKGMEPIRPPFSALDAALVQRDIFRSFAPEAIAVYVKTSGSTQVPRAFGLTAERLSLVAAVRAADPYERRVLRTSTMEYDSSRMHRVFALLAGNTCVFSERLDLDGIVGVCERAQVTDVHIGTYKLASLLNAAGAGVRRLPKGTRINTGGSRVPGHMRERVRAVLTDNLWVAYATSEIGVVSVAKPEEHAAFPEGVGHPVDGVEVEIVDEAGKPVPPGEIGRARIRKGGLPAGYVGDGHASASFQDGWFMPGDLLSRRPGEPLIYHGRVDDVMILNGINVFPAAIEDLLESQPGVLEAVAYPVASRLHGEIPVAAVVLAPEAREKGTAHLMTLCRQQLGVRAPRRIEAVEKIPRNRAGKPLRRKLAGG